jgi:hypothetical protein
MKTHRVFHHFAICDRTTEGPPFRDAFSVNGLDEQISWMSPRGFHVKAKPNQALAACVRQWDVTQGKWLSNFICIMWWKLKAKPSCLRWDHAMECGERQAPIRSRSNRLAMRICKFSPHLERNQRAVFILRFILLWKAIKSRAH